MKYQPNKNCKSDDIVMTPPHLADYEEGQDLQNAFDLINRLQAQNKDLAETVHNLTIEKDALFDKVEELKVEVERLKTNLNVELENFATEYDNKIKAEAIKKFAEKLRADWLFGGKDGKPYRETINNLVKEMVGEEK